MSKKKIYISPSNQTANTYATGNTNEKEQCHKIAKVVFDYLKKAGFSVKCTHNMSMEERVKESNNFKSDIHLAIHTNATSNHTVTGGTQILLYSISGEREKAGNCIMKHLAPITVGSSAEKLIAKPSFYEIKNATGMTLYVEVEFHDTKKGSDFIIKNTKAIGEAIAKGICDYYKVKYPVTAKPEPVKYYRVQVGAFTEKQNAEALAKKLKKQGYNAVIVE